MNCFLSSTSFDFKNKTVLVRIDCDVDLCQEWKGFEVDDDFRLRTALPTIKLLLEKGVGKIILMGHLGRPGGAVVQEFSLGPVADKFRELLSEKRKAKSEKLECKIQNFDGYQVDDNIILLENLRFDIREEENDGGFAKELAGLGDVYINEDFSVSHRRHASIVGIPKFLPSFLGLRFEGETKVLGDLRDLGNDKRPLVFVLGGSKSDKLDYLEFLGEWCDKVLVGGKLPLEISNQFLNFKFKILNLKTDGRDINDKSIKEAIEVIKTAKTIVWAGPMGVYEEKENQKGSFEIAKAIAESKAFKVAGGGDTHRILSLLNLWEKFDFVSVGGGAMLYFLKEGTLPGIEAVIK